MKIEIFPLVKKAEKEIGEHGQHGLSEARNFAALDQRRVVDPEVEPEKKIDRLGFEVDVEGCG